MVITSSTQWTIPLSSSSSSPPLTRHGSVLGLKTCKLSAPQQAMDSLSDRHLHQQDLHSTSSRRLQGGDYVPAPSRRSAGSFRQLVSEDFCAKLAQEEAASPHSPAAWVCNNDFECKYDGIAMPWCSSPLRQLDVAVGVAKRGKMTDFYGDITADDVDLLPMPGLLSCHSPFISDSTSHVSLSTQNEQKSKIFEVSSSKSSASISKASAMVPNYLGLPPEFSGPQSVENVGGEYAGNLRDNMHHCVSAPLTPPITIDHARIGGNHLFCAYHGNDTSDDFHDSLAGLWSNAANNGGIEYILHESESLASNFNVYPQKFHGFPSSSAQSCIETWDKESAHLVMDDWQYLINSSGESCEEKPNGTSALGGSSYASEALSANANSRNTVAQFTNASEPKRVAIAGTSAISCGSSLSLAHGINMETGLSALEKSYECIGLKRPFSALDLASMASSSMTSTSACVSGSNVWRTQPTNGTNSPMTTKEHGGPQVYKDSNVSAGSLYYHLATDHGSNIVDGEIMPKPPPTKVRRKHGTAMDPQSVAARTRREKFSERIRTLQSLIPNGDRLDTVAMLGQTLEYVRFLQHQVWQLYHGKDPASFKDGTCEKWKDFVEAAHASTG